MKHEILDILSRDGPLSWISISWRSGISRRVAFMVLDEMRNDGSIIKSRGKYRLSKTQIIMNVLHESGPCSYELLVFELKGKLSSQSIYIMDAEIQALIDNGRVRINKDGAHCVVN